MKKYMAFALALVMLALLPAGAGAEENYQMVASRDETVYAVLDASGAVKSLSTVVRAELEAGSWQDVGDYSGVKALSSGQIEYSAGVARFKLDEAGTFFYQGEMDATKLPWDVSVSYELDGETVTPEAMAGASGRVEITLSVTPNPDADAWFSENLALQAQLPIDLSRASIADAGGATVAITGNTATLAFIALAGQGIEAVITLDAANYRQDGLTLTAMKMDLSIAGLDEASDGISQLGEGMEALVSGLEQLDEGLSQLKGEADEESPMARLVAAGQQLTDGYGQLLAGIKEQSNITITQRLALDAFVSAASSEGANAAQAAVANYLKQAMDGAGAMADGLTQLNAGLEAYVSAVNALAEQLGEVPAGVSQLTEGARALKDGQAQLISGFESFLGDGEPYSPISFAAPRRASCDSVQFVIRLDGIEPLAAEIAPPPPAADASVWGRLADLFR